MKPPFYIIAFVLTLIASSASAQVTFTDVSQEAGVMGGYFHSLAVVWGDYDNDGDLDLYVSRGSWEIGVTIEEPDALYRNNGDGTFTDVLVQAGLGENTKNAVYAGFMDYDNDGYLDLYVDNERGQPPVLLYHNNRDGTFTDVIRYSGITFTVRGISSTFGDYDNDGDLDIYFINTASANTFYENNGDGTFTDATDEAGLGDARSCVNAASGDYDNDGDLDICIVSGVSSHMPTALYRNNGDGTFTDVAEEAGVSEERRGRGVAFFDYNNDGELDIYMAGWVSPTRLYRNNDDGTFTDVAQEAGVFLSDSEKVAVGDYDNDGYVDILVMLRGESSRLYHNNGDGTFTDVAKEAGVWRSGRFGGCAFADYDGDGDLDLYMANYDGPDWLYRNDGSDNNFLHVKLAGTMSNVDGIGARMMVQAGDLSMMREINGGCSRSQHELAAHFGLGKNARADRIEIRWPSGQVDVLRDIPANRFIMVGEGIGIIETRIAASVTRISPQEGRVTGGEPIAIFGVGFPDGAVVTIGGKPLTDITVTDTLITGITPPGTEGEKDIRIEAPDYGYSNLIGVFIYNPPTSIVLTGITPDNGKQAGGDVGRITGSGFLPGATVTIGGNPAADVGVNPTLIIFTIPPGTEGAKDVIVTNPDGQRAMLRDAFTYNTAPAITRVTPDNGRLAGGTRITIQGGGFQPGAEVRISINQGAYRAASSVEVMSSSIITALTPPGQPGAENVLVLNPDIQIAVLPEGFTYNHKPTITRLIPNHGPSSGGATITIEGSGFLLGARVVIGEKAATTMVRDDMTIEAVAPPNSQGVWDVRVINPDTQEVVIPGGYVSAGEVVYNYPNPFYASQGTTFRYVTKDPVLSVTVKIFNLRGRPIGAARQLGSNEVKWCDPDVHAGLYIYILEAEMADGKKRQVRNVMEVVE